jgi:hypothetical protein
MVATQVVMLVGILIVILFFRDFIADGAGDMLGSFGTSDVQVQQGSEAPTGSAQPAPSAETDAGPSDEPAESSPDAAPSEEL